MIELLVVCGIIALLLAILLPGLHLAREYAAEAVCQSNLQQLNTALKTYCSDNDSLFPDPTYIYHSPESFFDEPYGPNHPPDLRWHDADMGPGGRLMSKFKEFEGSLIPYVGNPKVLLCKTGARACLERLGRLDPNRPRRPQPSPPPSRGHRASGRGGGSGTTYDEDDMPVVIVPQYSFAMNGNLRRTLWTAGPVGGAAAFGLNPATFRQWKVRRETNVRRSPAEVFAFGEENSWQVNAGSRWPAPFNLSGAWGGTQHGTMNHPDDLTGKKKRNFKVVGALYLGSLDIGPSFTIFDPGANSYGVSRVMPETDVGDAFATYHRPRGGDLNRGHSYVCMLDGHTRKVTVSDQLRRSRQVEDIPESTLGPGGNLSLAWPLDVPPMGGWDNQ